MELGMYDDHSFLTAGDTDALCMYTLVVATALAMNSLAGN